jgi:hypothetical protein
MSHLAERFESASVALVGDGPIKHRLTEAYLRFLDGIEAQELPSAIRGEFGALRTALHRVSPVGKETAVRASVQKMSFAEAARHAAVIIKLYAEMARHCERGEPLKIIAPSGKAPARFLANGSS